MKLLQAYSQPNALLPYFYLPSYAVFVRTQGRELVFFSKDEYSMACLAWKNKFLKLLQPLYPPLTTEGKRLSPHQEKSFLNSFISFIEQNRLAHRITQPANLAIFHSYPDSSTHAPFGTYFLDLEQPEADLFANLHGKHRNVIRNAQKNNIELLFGKDCIKDFFRLYEQTMKRSSMYCEPVSYFRSFYEVIPENILCGVAYYHGKAQGAVFIPFTRCGAFYLHGASADQVEVTGAMNYLHWKSILLMKEKGVKRYDFVGARLSNVSGTKLEGIQQFKARFGTSLEEGFLWKKDLSVARCRLFDRLLGIKLRLKRQQAPRDIIDQELTNA